MKFFKVTCKCGHVGRQNYIPISFPICALSKKEASEKARYFPRVKHNRKFAIFDCKEINSEEFLVLKNEIENDPYLKCKNIQDQREIINLKSRILHDPEFIDENAKTEKSHRVSTIKYKRRKLLEISKNLFQMLREECY